jgi:hypothetical protein
MATLATGPACGRVASSITRSLPPHYLQTTVSLASVANSAARGDIAGVFLFVGGAAFGETSLSAKNAQLEQGSLAAAQEVGTTGAQSETVSVLIEEPNPNSPSKLGRKGMSGHTGVGVGDEYWDYGPQPGEGGNVFGSDGIPSVNMNSYYGGSTPLPPGAFRRIRP